MTLLEWLSGWWRTAPPVLERIAVPDTARPKPRIPAEYLPLYTYLERRYASTVVLTFEQMEALLGFALPGPARMERDWWTDAASHTARHSDAWTVANRTATPHLSAQTVAFERQP